MELTKGAMKFNIWLIVLSFLLGSCAASTSLHIPPDIQASAERGELDWFARNVHPDTYKTTPKLVEQASKDLPVADAARQKGITQAWCLQYVYTDKANQDHINVHLVGYIPPTGSSGVRFETRNRYLINTTCDKIDQYDGTP
jgi:hypothetical protein